MRGKNGILKIQLLSMMVERDFAANHPPLTEGPHVHFQISDTGHGMSREVFQRIFEPFFTTKPPGEGTGLGLSVVYGIVKAHQGAITVYSQPGIGTTFHVYLPALASGPKDEPVTEEQIPKGKGEHILYVDDEPSMCRLAEKVLARLGYVVTALSSSEEAINLFGWDSHSFDLVITDFTMPGITGTDLVERIRPLKPDIPVILASGLVSPELRVSAQKLGIKHILAKPFTTSTLANIVSRSINK